MKKVLVGVGIGCGALLLIAIVALVAGGYWVKSKMGGAVEVAQEMKSQQKEIESLDAKYPFQAPPEGEALKLSEGRLKQYLAVRASVAPIFKSFELKAKDFEKKNKKEKSLGAALEAVGMGTEMIREVRAKYLEQLEAQQMAPTEFHGITGAIYSAHLGRGMAQVQKGQREALQRTIEALDKQLSEKSLPEEQREALSEQRAAMEEQLAELPPEGEELTPELAVHEANAALLDKYKLQIEKEANPGLDVFLFGTAEGMEKAFAPFKKAAGAR